MDKRVLAQPLLCDRNIKKKGEKLLFFSYPTLFPRPTPYATSTRNKRKKTRSTGCMMQAQAHLHFGNFGGREWENTKCKSISGPAYRPRRSCPCVSDRFRALLRTLFLIVQQKKNSLVIHATKRVFFFQTHAPLFLGPGRLAHIAEAYQLRGKATSTICACLSCAGPSILSSPFVQFEALGASC